VNPLRLRPVPDEEDQVLRLLAFPRRAPGRDHRAGRVRHLAARIPEPDGETVATRYTLREPLDRLDELTGQQD